MTATTTATTGPGAEAPPAVVAGESWSHTTGEPCGDATGEFSTDPGSGQDALRDCRLPVDHAGGVSVAAGRVRALGRGLR